MTDAVQSGRIAGCVDGYREGHVHGWAWRPDQPNQPVTVELLVDGVLAAESTACLPRPDLTTAGIGRGYHAFEIPFVAGPAAPPLLHLTVRAKGGPILPGGELDLDLSAGSNAESALRGMVERLVPVFGRLDAADDPQPRRNPAPGPPPLTFVLFAALGATQKAGTLGMPEYSYVFVLRGFREVLRRLGTVHVISDPAEAEAIHARCLALGQSCLLLSFTPPQSMPLGLTCPIVPVIAWEFGTIPTGGWSADPREDWRLALRQAGRAITISDFAARAVRAGMGANFPVAFVPTPVWDRLAGLRARLGESRPPIIEPQRLRLEGFAWDSRASTVALDMRTPPFPAVAPPRPAPVLPMRGALLALAIASAAGRPQEASPEAIIHERTGPEPEITPAHKAPSSRLRVTASLGRQWYRDVVRDALPRPVATVVGKAGGMAVRAGRRLAASPEHAPAPPAITTERVQKSAAALPASQAVEPLAGPDDAGLPANARYLPVGDQGEVPTPQTARYLPASWDEPLPEFDLAVFHPDPYPATGAEPDPRVEVTIGGTVFTAVLAPKDGRKNWQDILSAFVMAFATTAEATLVLKMIGTDASYWWFEFHDIVKRLPPFACRVLVLNGYLADESYQDLIAGTHYIVNASLAEGQCLPLVEFMSAARPAIAPAHTAMLDYITPENSFIVRSDAEFCSWPHDPSNQLTTTRHRVEWSALREAFTSAWQVLHNDPAGYAAMSRAANESARAYCSDAVVAPALAAFLGLGDEVLARHGWKPIPRPAAEPLLEAFHAPAPA